MAVVPTLPAPDDGPADDESPLSYQEVALLLGCRASTLRSYLSRGQFIAPDEYDSAGRPRWLRERVLVWFAERPGRGNYPRAPR